jgi:hypothetical protein
MPFLLEALDDTRPTKLQIKPRGLLNSGFPDDGGPYTVKVGDICYVALGQIVGRPYQAVMYIPTGIIGINSPTQDPELAKEIRAEWSSNDHVQHLYKALLADYQTKPVFNGETLDGWHEGSDLQIGAAMRLLYYFPRQSGPMIADRLDRLNVEATDDVIKREVANGVLAEDFIRAVAWCNEPAVREALLRIFQRTTEPSILLAALPGIGDGQGEFIRTQLEAHLAKLPESEDFAQGDGYNLLVALGQRAGKLAKPAFLRYMRDASLQRRWTMCHVLRETNGEWAIEFLSPMLADKSTGYAGVYAVILHQWEATLPVRLCDAAADTLSFLHPELKFEMAGEHRDLDRQIDGMRKQIAQRRQ